MRHSVEHPPSAGYILRPAIECHMQREREQASILLMIPSEHAAAALALSTLLSIGTHRKSSAGRSSTGAAADGNGSIRPSARVRRKWGEAHRQPAAPGGCRKDGCREPPTRP